MEKIPQNNEHLNEQMDLARKLFDAVNKRSDFINAQGGLDNIGDPAWFNGEEIKKGFEQIQQAVVDAQKEFEGKVPDKKQFMQQLRENDHDTMADSIERLFFPAKPEQKGNMFTRLFKK